MKNENTKNKNKNKSIVAAGKVGRKAKTIKWPTAKKFTVPDMVKANEGNCGKLCIIQNLLKDAKLGKKSVVIKTDERLANASGKGRKLEVYMLRAKVNGATTKVNHTVHVADIKPITTTAEYEATKAALTAPEPVAATPVAVETAPVIEPVVNPTDASTVETAPVAIETPVAA